MRNTRQLAAHKIWPLACALGVLLILPAQAQRAFLQPAPAIRIIDGDTLQVRREHVRAYGYDAPEIFHPRCPAEKALGLTARAALADMLSPPHTVTVRVRKNKKGHVEKDKYGRVLGRIFSDGADVAPRMIARGLAHPYFGTGPRQGWC